MLLLPHGDSSHATRVVTEQWVRSRMGLRACLIGCGPTSTKIHTVTDTGDSRARVLGLMPGWAHRRQWIPSSLFPLPSPALALEDATVVGR